jgi:hypothetical protein
MTVEAVIVTVIIVVTCMTTQPELLHSLCTVAAAMSVTHSHAPCAAAPLTATFTIAVAPNASAILVQTLGGVSVRH